ncbi:hypothetical protein RND81_05G256300 [Saponaria officinalis]|uniref:Uncharacterized protein n=1 Tax=Saponaria officinalis TaxID=3572 RepID=A0AAW1L3S8_SAPOF
MTMTAKHLMRPYMTMVAQSYAAAAAASLICRPHRLHRSAYLHVSASHAPLRVTISPTFLPISTKTRLKNGHVRGFCSTIRASSPHHVNDPGSIDSSLMQSMQTKIKDELNAESVVVKDAYGDGRHVSIVVVSSSFEGQSAVNRQRMVYKAIWEELQSTVHAVDQMITKTPSEAGDAK